MNAEYFKHQICDEIEGAKDYIIRAVEIKPMSEAWATKLTEMSSQELNHAKQLYGMWREYYIVETKDGIDNIPEYLQKTNDKITKYYLEESAKIQYMHQQIK